jgi:hypothetical protein
MESLVLFESSDLTPKITLQFSDNTILFEGYSLPANPFEFYQEVISKIIKTISQYKLGSFAVHIELRYFNTASAKSFYELFKKLDQHCIENHKTFTIMWQYMKEDDDVKETVFIFKELFKNIPFIIKEIN